MLSQIDNFRYDLFSFENNSIARRYYDHVQRGADKAAELSVVICGLARNVVGALSKNIPRIEKIAGMFREAHIVVYENDSTDVTPYALLGWQTINPKVHVVCEKLNQPVNRSVRCLARALRMAICRNKLRQYVVSNFGATASHVIVLDMDMPGGWAGEGILHSFGQPTPWDFMGSNGVLFRQYDTRGIVPCYYDVWAWRWPGSDKPCRAEDINPLVFKRGSDLVPTGSCFGGMGLYRMDAFERCSYDGSDCEHVPFHRKMREAGMGRLFMNPSQLVLYNKENFDIELAAHGKRTLTTTRKD